MRKTWAQHEADMKVLGRKVRRQARAEARSAATMKKKTRNPMLSMAGDKAAQEIATYQRRVKDRTMHARRVCQRAVGLQDIPVDLVNIVAEHIGKTGVEPSVENIRTQFDQIKELEKLISNLDTPEGKAALAERMMRPIRNRLEANRIVRNWEIKNGCPIYGELDKATKPFSIGHTVRLTEDVPFSEFSHTHGHVVNGTLRKGWLGTIVALKDDINPDKCASVLGWKPTFAVQLRMKFGPTTELLVNPKSLEDLGPSDAAKPCHAVGSCGAHEVLGNKECATCRSPNLQGCQCTDPTPGSASKLGDTICLKCGRYATNRKPDSQVAEDPEAVLVRRLTAAMREADEAFKSVGGSTRHYVRDCLLPILGKHEITLSPVDENAALDMRRFEWLMKHVNAPRQVIDDRMAWEAKNNPERKFPAAWDPKTRKLGNLPPKELDETAKPSPVAVAVAQALKECASTWDSNACLLGNVTARDIIALCDRAILDKLNQQVDPGTYSAYYVVSSHSHTDRQFLVRLLSRRLNSYADAEVMMQVEQDKEAKKTKTPKHRRKIFQIVRATPGGLLG